MLIASGWLVVLATAFILGYLLAAHDLGTLQQRIARLQMERDTLSEGLAAAREQRVRLERSHQIDAEAKRSAQEALALLQRERLTLVRRTTYLERLVRAGGSGLIEVTEHLLEPADIEGQYRFAFTIRQRFPEVGDTTGLVRLKLELAEGAIDAPIVALGAEDKVPKGKSIRLDFAHFQRITGVLEVPEGAEPKALLIEVLPDDGRSIALEESVIWGEDRATLPSDAFLPALATEPPRKEPLE